jgi:hypothetical protein
MFLSGYETYPYASTNVNPTNPVNRKHNLARGLVGWWLTLPTQQGSVNWFDISGNRNHGTFINLAGTINGFRGARPGSFGSMKFDGTVTTGCYADLSNAFARRTLGQLTISAWINVSTLPASGDFGGIVVLQGGQTYLVAENTSGTLWIAAQLSNGAGAGSNTTSTFAFGKWAHVAMTANSGGTTTIYINAKAVATGASGTASTVNDENTIGSYAPVRLSNAHPFPGFIDDVRVYTRVLGQNEISQIYTNSLSGYQGLLNYIGKKSPYQNNQIIAPPNGPNTAQLQIRNNLRTTNIVNTKHNLAIGLVGWWLTLPTTTGSVKWFDISGNRNHGTLTTMAKATNGFRQNSRQGGFGSVLFDGTAGYVNVGTIPATQPGPQGSAGVWLNLTSLPSAARGILCTANLDTGLQGFSLRIDGVATGSTLSFDVGSNSVSINTTTGISEVINKWVHFYATWNGATINLYRNGVLVKTASQTTGVGSNVFPTSIGANGAATDRFFPGYIDDVRIYNRALNAREIQQLYLNSLAGYPGLLLHRNYLPLSAPEIYDWYGSGGNTGIKGIDILQTDFEIVLRACLLNSNGSAVTTGTTQLYLFEVQDDGGLKHYDWYKNQFTSGTVTGTFVQAKQQSGTGIWSYNLMNIGGFTNGAIYLAEFFNANATPSWQVQEFQFGNQPGDDGFFSEFTIGVGSTTTIINTNRTEAASYWNSAEVAFTTGALRGKSAKITSYSGGSFTLSAALPTTPNTGDRGLILTIQ